MLWLICSFPRDNETYDNDRQFLWGEALTISPVLSEVGYNSCVQDNKSGLRQAKSKMKTWYI